MFKNRTSVGRHSEKLIQSLLEQMKTTCNSHKLSFKLIPNSYEKYDISSHVVFETGSLDLFHSRRKCFTILTFIVWSGLQSSHADRLPNTLILVRRCVSNWKISISCVSITWNILAARDSGPSDAYFGSGYFGSSLGF